MGSKKLPPDEITVYEGRVVKLVEYTMWGGQPQQTLKVKWEPESDDFTVSSFDPEHGGNSVHRGKTMLEAARKVFSPKTAAKLAELFDLEDPSEKQIRTLHKRQQLKVVFL